MPTNTTTAVVETSDPPWPGFYAPLYTQVPDELFDYWLPQLSEAELKVLLYIIRRTFGFKKQSDEISRNQMVSGIVSRDGRRIDHGAGVGATAVKAGIKGLLAKGLIDARHNQSPERGNEATTYRLRLRADPEPPLVEFRPGGWSENDQGGGSNSDQGGGSENDQAGGPDSDQGLGRNSTPQETVKQETVTRNSKQERQQKRVKPAEADVSEDNASNEAESPPPYSAWIAAVVTDYGREMNDLANGVSNVERALRLWQRSGLREARFVEALQQAKLDVRKAQAQGVANKMRRLFELLERAIGSG